MGWLTNHEEGDVGDGHFTYFVKIVWVGPGRSLWGEYEIIQEVGSGEGLIYKDGPPGLGVRT